MVNLDIRRKIAELPIAGMPHLGSGITFAWMKTLQQLTNGNLIIGSNHAGHENPQLIEVTRDKKIVWQFKDFTNFGNNLVAAQVLGIKGKVIR